MRVSSQLTGTPGIRAFSLIHPTPRKCRNVEDPMEEEESEEDSSEESDSDTVEEAEEPAAAKPTMQEAEEPVGEKPTMQEAEEPVGEKPTMPAKRRAVQNKGKGRAMAPAPAQRRRVSARSRPPPPPPPSSPPQRRQSGRLYEKRLVEERSKAINRLLVETTTSPEQIDSMLTAFVGDPVKTSGSVYPTTKENDDDDDDDDEEIPPTQDSEYEVQPVINPLDHVAALFRENGAVENDGGGGTDTEPLSEEFDAQLKNDHEVDEDDGVIPPTPPPPGSTSSSFSQLILSPRSVTRLNSSFNACNVAKSPSTSTSNEAIRGNSLNGIASPGTSRVSSNSVANKSPLTRNNSEAVRENSSNTDPSPLNNNRESTLNNSPDVQGDSTPELFPSKPDDDDDDAATIDLSPPQTHDDDFNSRPLSLSQSSHAASQPSPSLLTGRAACRNEARSTPGFDVSLLVLNTPTAPPRAAWEDKETEDPITIDLTEDEETATQLPPPGKITPLLGSPLARPSDVTESPLSSAGTSASLEKDLNSFGADVIVPQMAMKMSFIVSGLSTTQTVKAART